MQEVELPATSVVTGQATVTPLMVGSGVTVTVAVADLVESSTLTAFTVTDVPVVGAVRTPLALMDPAVVDQVTAEE